MKCHIAIHSDLNPVSTASFRKAPSNEGDNPGEESWTSSPVKFTEVRKNFLLITMSGITQRAWEEGGFVVTVHLSSFFIYWQQPRRSTRDPQVEKSL